MRNTSGKSGIGQVLHSIIVMAMAIFPKVTQELLVERFDSFGLELQKVSVNKEGAI